MENVGFIGRKLGVLVSINDGNVTAYAAGGMEDRGELFVEPGTKVYEGMVVGLCNREEDLAVNITRAKQMTNQRSSTKDSTVVLKAPRILKDYEQASPKLFTNIILGIVFGVIASLIALIFKEVTDKKLAYSMLGDNIIYNSEKDFINLKRILLTNQDKKITLVAFEQLPASLLDKLKDYKNLNMVQADISNDFVNGVEKASEVVLFASVNKTDAELYKQVKQMINEMNKNILKEVLV
jgi:hypothetical protein